MLHQSKFRWTVAAVIVACVVGLAMAGGSWQISSAQTTTGETIPNIDTLTPGWVKVYQQEVSVTITGWRYITGWPTQYTKIVFEEVGKNNPPIELSPLLTQEFQLNSRLLPASIMGHPGVWNVWVVNHHEPPQEDEVGNKMRFAVSTGNIYLPMTLFQVK